MYKYFVTVVAFLTVWAWMFLTWNIHITSDMGNRYQIVDTSSNILLLDKRTGLVWRNVWNNNKDKILSDWEMMNYPMAGPDFQPLGNKILELKYPNIDSVMDEMKTDKEIAALSEKEKDFYNQFYKAYKKHNSEQIKKQMKDAGYKEERINKIESLAYSKHYSTEREKERLNELNKYEKKLFY